MYKGNRGDAGETAPGTPQKSIQKLQFTSNNTLVHFNDDFLFINYTMKMSIEYILCIISMYYGIGTQLIKKSFRVSTYR